MRGTRLFMSQGEKLESDTMGTLNLLGELEVDRVGLKCIPTPVHEKYRI